MNELPEIIPEIIEDITIHPEGRYHRQSLIPWWDQQRVAKARVLVVGAGALGNEILKLLALTGVGSVLLIDMDIIERSNLSRTVLFRETDEGCYKAEVAARRVMEINPGTRAVGYPYNVEHKVGLGVFLWADVVICGLDNRAARIFVNGACARAGRAWIDGGIEGLSGYVRVFDPARTACYECAMNETDRQEARRRRSCAMLARDDVARGRVPTTAVAGSLVAALQTQEAIKFLHGQPTLYGEGLYVHGAWNDFSRIGYQRRADCPAHDPLGKITPLGCGVADLSLRELLERAENALGEGATLDLSRDVVTHLTCPDCGNVEKCGVPLGAVREEDASCPHCRAHRLVDFTGVISRDGGLDLSNTPADLGIPPFDVVVARRGIEAGEAWLFDGDAPAALGPLAGAFDVAGL
ncbi:MAG TPA: ThiF family adenylyltransferase [Blastocatellia bacterium]|jgi:adenylyltransferase/sulfurtransferase|nr:ThiF family adenylyltransferase [Blastocatellia bacterium]